MVAEMIQQCVSENARIAQDQAEYQKRYDALYTRYETAKAKLDKLAQAKQEQATKRETILRFLAELEQQDGLLDTFDEDLWYATVDEITVHPKATIVTFKDGTSVQAGSGE